MIKLFIPYILTLFLFLVNLSALLGQQWADSLRLILPNAKGKEKAQILIDLTEILKKNQRDQAIEFAEQALSLSKKIEFQDGIYTTSLFLGIEARDNKQYGKAAQYAKTSRLAAQATGNKDAELKSLELMIFSYRLGKKTKRFKQAQIEYNKLRNELDLVQSKLDINSLENQLQTTEKQSAAIFFENMELEDSLQSALAIQTLLKLQQTELQLKIVNLERDSMRREIEISKQEAELQTYNLELAKQRRLIIYLITGLAVAVAFSWLLALYFKLKRTQSEEKARIQRQLIMQDKMASLGQLTAGIAHEIKNPLNFVNNFSEGSMDMVNELEEVLDHYQKHQDPADLDLCKELLNELKGNASDIKSNGKRIDRIVKSMMEHSNGNPGEIQRVNINELIQENINLAYHGYRGNHSTFSAALEGSFDPNLPKIEVIPQDLSRALLNILGNACYALHQKQQQNIPDYISKLKVSTQKEKGEVIIRIWDNGPGIPKEVQSNIFTPFFTTKPLGEGNTGLGLSITNDIIVQGHHGKLEVESEPGSYTRFSISLPV